MSNQPEALLVARELDEQRITNWTNSTGMPPKASGTRPHGLSIRAAALLRSQHARIERLERVLEQVIIDAEAQGVLNEWWSVSREALEQK